MADFHLMCCLLIYSGGTVPDSNRIPYSLLNRHDPAALNRILYFISLYRWAKSLSTDLHLLQ